MSPRISAIALVRCSWRIINNFALRMARAFSLFCNWERSWVQRTAIPVGKWVIRTAVSTLLTFWPPLPPALEVVMSKSLSGISKLIDSSPNMGIISTPAKLV